MGRVFHLLLALGMAVATAYCGCAAAATHVLTGPAHRPTRLCCRDDSPAGSPWPAEQLPHDAGHDCPHCRGTTAANPTPPFDSDSFRPALLTPMFAWIALPLFGVDRSAIAHRIDLTSLPPPRPSATLLDLFCALTT